MAIEQSAVIQAKRRPYLRSSREKVLELMNSMLEKGKRDTRDEELQCASYKQFGDDTSVENTNAIEETNGTITNGDIHAATKVCHQEKSACDKTHADYLASADALERAIAVPKKQTYNGKQASFFAVEDAQRHPPECQGHQGLLLRWNFQFPL